MDERYIKCPYCNNHIPLKIVKKRKGIRYTLVWETEEETFSYSIECSFCKRKYILFKFDNYEFLKKMLRFNDQTLGWIKRYNVDLRNIDSRIVGVTEPMTPRYKRFSQRIKTRLKKYKGRTYTFIRFIEIIFEQKYGDEIYRGVLAGRQLSSDSENIINIENSYWLNTAPIEVD